MAALSAEDLTGIETALAAGRKPKVQFTEAAGQIAGQIGQVVALTDRAASDEFVVVKFGRDELPFSPSDLRIAPRGATAPVKKAPEPAPVVPPGPEFMIDKPAPAPRTPVEAPAKAESPAPAPRKAAAKPAKAKPGPSLTVTLAYGEGEWTVAAQQGAKALARPYVIRPAEALKIVSLVDVPGVQEAVEQIMAAERAEAQAQAERLRAELAEVEARLAELT
ncbi:hypothetical protein AMIS_41570 [Actinoplanes missouriensis 431]|uniref:Translation initiation factor n=1 Tax=Actinoplanes missouriensis (strain ATCC 14538 / DSM 43046 / CBS 188.64 / JCM 3121 / NBRC 102363 / NCIMB 12654 / NRRL B-3342 / UNCC 431) TaxID=512565 RepID=I0H8P0_ACTM4|nr:hypothetical protein [Actinoplanes missouriensis]BAL89377.1 hypothetical protein AMIS_41570 [Actinoplanes missouriensis 431]